MSLRSRLVCLLPSGLLVLAAACGGGTVGVEQLNQSSTPASGSSRSGSGSGSSNSDCGPAGTCETTESITETATDSFCCVTETESASTDTGTVTGTFSTGTVSGVTGTVGPVCVDIQVTPADQACRNPGDCTFVASGQICTGSCDCGGTPVNSAAASQIQSELAGIVLEDCPCDVVGQPECIMGVCTLCGFGPNQPPGCGGATDAGTGPGEQCVDIDLSTYKTTCAEASDCILIDSGELCSGDCFCPGSAVSASEQSKFDQATAGLQFGECGCPVGPSPQCIAGQCVACFGSPYDPPGCATDAGR